MSTLTPFRRLVSGMVCALALGACSTAPVVVAKKPTLDEALAQATLALNAGQKDKAMSLWKEAATQFPADKTPWLKMAQTKYDAGQYGEAIVNAQEVLVRDPADKVANSMIATSGLRLATRALSDLSRQNNLTPNTRTEAQDLAKLLRESLGETVLFSTNGNPAPKAAARSAASSARKAVVKPADDDSSANPFNALK
ncbi:MAG: hypothetical protein V4754_13795 [Pseudomonadota bacterium]